MEDAHAALLNSSDAEFASKIISNIMSETWGWMVWGPKSTEMRNEDCILDATGCPSSKKTVSQARKSSGETKKQNEVFGVFVCVCVSPVGCHCLSQSILVTTCHTVCFNKGEVSFIYSWP